MSCCSKLLPIKGNQCKNCGYIAPPDFNKQLPLSPRKPLPTPGSKYASSPSRTDISPPPSPPFEPPSPKRRAEMPGEEVHAAREYSGGTGSEEERTRRTDSHPTSPSPPPLSPPRAHNHDADQTTPTGIDWDVEREYMERKNPKGERRRKTDFQRVVGGMLEDASPKKDEDDDFDEIGPFVSRESSKRGPTHQVRAWVHERG